VEVEEMDENRTTPGREASTEAAVLQHVLYLHPTQISFDEVLREIAADPADFGERDAVECAVRNLGAAGLLRRADEMVLPTLAALRFDELLGQTV
jgi:hypothetical protein